MKVSDKTYRELQALILKSEGKTLKDEFEFGCDYLGKNGDKFRCVKTEPGFVWGRLWRHSKLGKSIYKQYTDCSFGILGQPIGIDRILKTLALIDVVWRLEPSSKYTVDIIFDTEETPERIVWSLDLPAHFQEEETITKLTELLK